ncbi:hypothetical protein OF820_04280 [Oceanotoga sp. DSM 15011]|jgi:hypothetical protein|uniref:Uncharacterized protein n=1 Tax=Oceanotoga teriensis TaxID=515440 RepID=A0AA45HJB0_9BACT|nr:MULTISPECIES: hypothetical protein [Oceanotoga]MDN5343240.1 hypothetical protein [Oceanotoga sp.]MDO7976793.1 hypothetical protein [Oceanotoga teriensis]PWJ95869.1 hypothetical protein C7380_10346 [Oceanotoga teriensis]UYP00906.1 hypothetical protein OF820_04280 [Oceanotoga sp. DSM 15011]
MNFSSIIFDTEGNYHNVKRFLYKSFDTLILTEINPEDYFANISSGLIGYFLVEEGNQLSGMRRYLKPDLRMKKSLKTLYVDYISDEIRDIYGDYIELISDNIGLRKVMSSFNDLIESKEIIANYDNWIDGISKEINSKNRELIAQKITKFANIYLIRVYERLYGKNIDLLKQHESEIAYKILETSLMQKTF